MKALYYDGRLSFHDNFPVPVPREKESLIKIRLAAICKTDREMLKNYRPSFKGVLGHEFTGEVVSSKDKNLIGKRVVGEINQNCGHCIYCLEGKPHHCINRKTPGINNKDGCFAEFMTLRDDLLHIIPDSVTDEEAVYTEPLAAALQIFELSEIKPSASVCIIGDGRLAYMTAQLFKLRGNSICILGRHEDKLKMFSGFAEVCMESKEQFDVVADATGSEEGLKSAVRHCKSRGLIVLKSTYAGTSNINMSEIAVREIRIQGSRCGPFLPALNLLKRSLLTLPKIELFRLEDFESAFNSNSFKSGFAIAKI